MLPPLQACCLSYAQRLTFSNSTSVQSAAVYESSTIVGIAVLNSDPNPEWLNLLSEDT
jgi:hypothetical protein